MAKKQRKYNKVLSYAATPEQINKLQTIADLMGLKMSEVVRRIIDTAVPEVDPNNLFWNACRQSKILGVDMPINGVVAFICSFFNFKHTGENEIEGVRINFSPPAGLSPTLWALKQVEENFYGSDGLRNKSDKQDD